MTAADHVVALVAISGKIEAAHTAWEAANAAEDAVLRAYDEGKATLADLLAANGRANTVWASYAALCDEGERILTASRASRVTS